MRTCLSRILGTSVLLLSFTLAMPATGYAAAFSRTNVPAQIKVTVSATNVRSGPATSFKVVGSAYQGTIIECIGKLSSNTTWWVVHMADDTIGAIYGPNAKPYYPPTPAPAPSPTPAPSPQISTEKQQMLDLINAERVKVGATPLKADPKVMEVSQIKSDDMVKNKYFSHTSPTYGSPFDMLRKFGVTFYSAAENIAENVSVEAAHAALMASEGHRTNILDPSYNYLGIGITESSSGKIFVQMFIQK